MGRVDYYIDGLYVEEKMTKTLTCNLKYAGGVTKTFTVTVTQKPGENPQVAVPTDFPWGDDDFLTRGELPLDTSIITEETLVTIRVNQDDYEDFADRDDLVVDLDTSISVDVEGDVDVFTICLADSVSFRWQDVFCAP